MSAFEVKSVTLYHYSYLKVIMPVRIFIRVPMTVERINFINTYLRNYTFVYIYQHTKSCAT